MAEKVSRSFAIFEDTLDWVETMGSLLRDRGHTVGITASTRQSSLAAITLQNFRLHNIFAALVDGDMSQNPRSNEDGVAITEAIIALNLGIRILSLAAIPIPRAEFFINKSDFYSSQFYNDLESIGA